MPTGTQPLRSLAALLITLAIVHFVPDRLLTTVALLALWWIVFRPLARAELVLFALAGAFFLVQNHLALRDGLFEFRHKDVLLMPAYEPFLWGFYFLTLKRLVGPRGAAVGPGWPSVLAVVVTSAAFSAFGSDSRTLFAATLASTAFLLTLFHDPADFLFAGYALGLGFVVELFGVGTGLWWYPAPDVLGMPYWSATMWVSVGVLGRRFLIPAAERLARLLRPQPA